MLRRPTVTFYLSLFVFSLRDGIIGRNLPIPTPISTLAGTTTQRPVAGPMVLLPTTATTIQNVISSSPQYTSPTRSSLAESTDIRSTREELETDKSTATYDSLPTFAVQATNADAIGESVALSNTPYPMLATLQACNELALFASSSSSSTSPSSAASQWSDELVASTTTDQSISVTVTKVSSAELASLSTVKHTSSSRPSTTAVFRSLQLSSATKHILALADRTSYDYEPTSPPLSSPDTLTEMYSNGELPSLPSDEQILSASSASHIDILERSSTPSISTYQRTSTSPGNKFSLATSEESTSVLSSTYKSVSPSSGESLSPTGTVKFTPSSGGEFISAGDTSLSPSTPVIPFVSRSPSLLTNTGSSSPVPLSSSSRATGLEILVSTLSSSFVRTPELQTVSSSRLPTLLQTGEYTPSRNEESTFVQIETPERSSALPKPRTSASPSTETRRSTPRQTTSRSTTSTLSFNETNSEGSKTQIFSQGHTVNAISKPTSSDPLPASTFQTTPNSLTECEEENCETTGQASEAEQWKTIATVGLTTTGLVLLLLVVGSVIFFKSYFKSRMRKMSPRVVPEGSADQPEHFEVEGSALNSFETGHVDTGKHYEGS